MKKIIIPITLLVIFAATNIAAKVEFTKRPTPKLMKEHNYTNGHLEVLAELFNAEAELKYVRNDKPGCLEFSEKSLILFEFIDTEYKIFSMERINKMEALRNRITELSNL